MEPQRVGRQAAAILDPETTVSASILVDVPVDVAFRVFTSDMGAWWPESHHIGTAALSAAIIEPRVGGRWYELDSDGTTCDWGLVLAWDPPDHVAMSWQLTPEFRRDGVARHASRIDVRFEPRPDGTTLVTLIHSDLQNHGEGWRDLRDKVGAPGGWAGILRIYGDRAGSSASGRSVT